LWTHERGSAVAEIPEPLRESLCKRIKDYVDSAIREAERTGRIKDIDVFTSLVYYGSQLAEHYRCELSEPKTRLIVEVVKHLYEVKR